jgi:hypothetical protein
VTSLQCIRVQERVFPCFVVDGGGLLDFGFVDRANDNNKNVRVLKVSLAKPFV